MSPKLFEKKAKERIKRKKTKDKHENEKDQPSRQLFIERDLSAQ